MNKFEKVKKALEDKTYDTNDYRTLTKNTDARHNGKYATRNVVTNNVNDTSYKTLKEVIEEFKLTI